MIIQFETAKLKNLRQVSSNIRKYVDRAVVLYSYKPTVVEITEQLGKRTKHLNLRPTTTITAMVTVRFVLMGKEVIEQTSITASYKYLLKIFGGEDNILYACYNSDEFEATLTLFIIPVRNGILSYTALFQEINKQTVITQLTLFATKPEVLKGTATHSYIPEYVRARFILEDFEDESMPDEGCESYEMTEVAL